MSIWTRIWTAWAISLALHILFFGVVEAVALKRPEFGDTLTETVVSLRDANSWIYFLVIDVVTLTGITMAWLVWHFRYWAR